MGTKKETTTTNQYNPQSMNTFNSLQTPVQNTLTDYMKDPLTASYFNQHLQQSLGQQHVLNQRGMSNLFTRGQMMGYGQNSGAMAQLVAAQGRHNAGEESNIFLNNLFSAENNRLNATNMAMGYKPLQTGQNTVEKTSGLGTWLPQVIGAGVAGASAFMTGGMSGLAKAGGSMGGSLMASGSGLASNIMGSSGGAGLWGNPFQNAAQGGYSGVGGSFSRPFVAAPSYGNIFGPGFRG